MARFVADLRVVAAEIARAPRARAGSREPMDETFRPTLLLSMPQLQDPNFTRTVVLLCDYTEEGAFGLVLNRPTEMPATTMVKLDPPIAGGNELPLSIGGPVEPERGWILTSVAPEDAEYREIQEGLYL